MDIVAAIDQWGKQTPDHVAHRSGDACLTYGRLRHDSDQLAAQLLHSLAPDSAPIVVLGHKEPEMLIAFLGVLKAGRAYIPVDTSWPEARVAQVVAASACAVVLTPEDVRQRLTSAWMGLKLMRWNTLRVLSQMDGAELPREAMIGKLLWSNWHRDLGNLAMDVLGPAADLAEQGQDGYELTALQRLFLFTRSDTIYAGSNEIQRNIIGERALGLPPEPKVAPPTNEKA